MFSAPPIGCVPSQRTLAGGIERDCAENYNEAATLFNRKLSPELHSLARTLPGSKLVYLDIYNPLLDIILNPQKYGIYLFFIFLMPSMIKFKYCSWLKMRELIMIIWFRVDYLRIWRSNQRVLWFGEIRGGSTMQQVASIHMCRRLQIYILGQLPSHGTGIQGHRFWNDREVYQRFLLRQMIDKKIFKKNLVFSSTLILA